MWLTPPLTDGFWQINEMWTSAVITLLAGIIFSPPCISRWLIVRVAILSKVKNLWATDVKLAAMGSVLETHKENNDKREPRGDIWKWKILLTFCLSFKSHFWNWKRSIRGFSVPVQGCENLTWSGSYSWGSLAQTHRCCTNAFAIVHCKNKRQRGLNNSIFITRWAHGS